jgi:hypothetical protein
VKRQSGHSREGVGKLVATAIWGVQFASYGGIRRLPGILWKVAGQ